MTSDNPVPPRPTRTSPPTLSPVVVPDWNDRGGPPIAPTGSTGSDFANLRKKVDQPASRAKEVAEPRIGIVGQARAGEGQAIGPPVATEAPMGVQAFTALAIVVSVVYAGFKETKRRAKERRR